MAPDGVGPPERAGTVVNKKEAELPSRAAISSGRGLSAFGVGKAGTLITFAKELLQRYTCPMLAGGRRSGE